MGASTENNEPKARISLNLHLLSLNPILCSYLHCPARITARSQETSLTLQCRTSAKSQDQIERDLGRHLPLSQVPESCSGLRTPTCLITEVPYRLCKTHPSTTGPPLPMPTGVRKRHLAPFYLNCCEFGNPVSAAKFLEGPRPIGMSKSHIAETATEVLSCMTAQQLAHLPAAGLPLPKGQCPLVGWLRSPSTTWQLLRCPGLLCHSGRDATAFCGTELCICKSDPHCMNIQRPRR